MEAEVQVRIARLFEDSKVNEKVFSDPVNALQSQPKATSKPRATAKLNTPALQVSFTNTDVFTTDKLRELKLRLEELDSDIIAVSEIKHQE